MVDTLIEIATVSTVSPRRPVPTVVVPVVAHLQQFRFGENDSDSVPHLA
jgi:hypothetical protein